MKLKSVYILLFSPFILLSQNLTVATDGSISVQKDGYVFVGSDFTNTSGTVTLNSDSDEFSSLLVSGTSSGNITYNRYVNMVGTDEWDLIGAPVSGMAFGSLITDTNIANNGSGVFAVGSYKTTLQRIKN